MTHEQERARFLSALERVRARVIVLDADALAALHDRISAGVVGTRRRRMTYKRRAMPQPYVSTGDLARVADVSIPYIRECITRGELRAIPIGHGTKIKPRSRIYIVEAVRFLGDKGFTVPRDWRKLADDLG